MARRKNKKKTTSWLSALIIETLAVVAFAGLFLQARAQRQQESAGQAPTTELAAWPSILEQTPFADVVSLANGIGKESNPGRQQNTAFSPEAFLNQFSISNQGALGGTNSP